MEKENWNKIKIGMTKSEVFRLMGIAPSVHYLSVDSQKENICEIEFWEYGYKSHFYSVIPHSKSFAIYFNTNGIVTKLKEPEIE